MQTISTAMAISTLCQLMAIKWLLAMAISTAVTAPCPMRRGRHGYSQNDIILLLIT